MIHSSDSRSRDERAAHNNVFGRYRLIADIGHGGMADVYLAVTEGSEAAAKFQKLLVIKMLKRELGEDPEFVKMFLNEARLAARLNHPNVVQTIEVGEAGGRYFLAMEYLEGQPLHRILRNVDAQENLGPAMRLHIMIHALAGLNYAHDCQDYDGTSLDIVHRDVSPANLFVTYDGNVKLMDFGIAKARDSDTETRIGVFKGKAAYIAPEQARGEPVDRRADIYSAGVLLWELITGRRLWSGLTQIEILRKVISGDVPKPSSVNPAIAPDLERMCMKALAVRREDRYATASEFSGELERFALRRFRAVSGRDVGRVIADAFIEDRKQIREVIEAHLAGPALPTSSLPDLRLLIDTGRSSTDGEMPNGSELHTLLETPRTGATLSRQPMVTPASNDVRPSQTRSTGPRSYWVGAGVLALAAVVFALIRWRSPPAPKPLESAPAALAPVDVGPRERGVSPDEIQIGMSAVFSGPSRDLGQNMKLGVETSFDSANAAGGVHGRKLRLTALDDAYEAEQAGATMKELIEQRGVFAIVGNVGTPTSMVAAPYAAERKTIFFGAFTGAPVLRQDPPDRYVFNYRASYKEETAKSLKYLLETRHLRPDEIVVFAQDDSYGDAGFEGVTKALRNYGFPNVQPLRVGYKRNTADIDAAFTALVRYNDEGAPPSAAAKARGVARTQKHAVKAVVMVATYRAAAKFIQRVGAVARLKDTLFFNVSFVGSESLADELRNSSPELCPNVYVTQVVPPFDSGATGVRYYRDELAKYQPQAQPGFVSLEGFIVGSIFVEALKRAGPRLTTERLVDALEQLRDLDLGFGTKIGFSPSEHQGSHKVWGTRLDEQCRYQAVDLE